MIKETLTTVFSSRLKRALEQCPELSQRKIAKILDKQPQTVNAWFNGKNTPTFEIIEELASLLGVDYSYFFGAAPEASRVGVKEALNIIMEANGLIPVREKGPNLTNVPPNILEALSKIEDFNTVEIAVLKQLAKEEREARYSN